MICGSSSAALSEMSSAALSEMPVVTEMIVTASSRLRVSSTAFGECRRAALSASVLNRSDEKRDSSCNSAQRRALIT